MLPHCIETYSICSVVLVVTAGKLHWKRFGFTTTQLDCAPANEAIAGEKAASGTTRANPSAIADVDRTDTSRLRSFRLADMVASTSRNATITTLSKPVKTGSDLAHTEPRICLRALAIVPFAFYPARMAAAIALWTP